MHDDDSLEDLARTANENHQKIVEGEAAAGVEPGAFAEALNLLIDEAIDAHYKHAREALPGEAQLLDRIL